MIQTELNIMKNIKLQLFTVILFTCLLMATGSIAWATNGEAVTNANPEEQTISEEEYSQNIKELMRFLEGRATDFSYQRENRSDPFMPFLREKVVDSEVEIESAESSLSGMMKFEPGQLAVVAIIQKRSGPVAMVQDSTGKGYIVSPGTRVGHSGIIDEITTNMILIKQQYRMTSGAIRNRVVKMLLKRVGE